MNDCVIHSNIFKSTFYIFINDYYFNAVDSLVTLLFLLANG